MAAVKLTGSESSTRTAVTRIDHTNKGKRSMLKPPTRIFNIVVIKFIAPNMEESPAKCKLNMAKSTEGPE